MYQLPVDLITIPFTVVLKMNPLRVTHAKRILCAVLLRQIYCFSSYSGQVGEIISHWAIGGIKACSKNNESGHVISNR